MDQTTILGVRMEWLFTIGGIALFAYLGWTVLLWLIRRVDIDDEKPRNTHTFSGETRATQRFDQGGMWPAEPPRDTRDIAAAIAALDAAFESEHAIQFSVAGESRTNSDGGDRQTILRRLRHMLETSNDPEAERIRLVRERHNRFDRNAIMVLCKLGQVGYITREDAMDLAPWIDGGRSLYAKVDKLIGGDAERASIGIWLSLSKFADFGAAREAAEDAAIEAEQEAVRAARAAEKEARRAAKLAEREAAAELKRQEREAAGATKRSRKPKKPNDAEG
jgi:hypothetical protein